MDSQFDAGDQVSYADKGEVWEGAVRSVGDGGVVCISGNDDDDDDDDDEYFAHSTNVVKRVPGHAEDLAPINQLPRGSVKEGDVFCLSANVANVSDARHWNSTASGSERLFFADLCHRPKHDHWKRRQRTIRLDSDDVLQPRQDICPF